MPKDIVATLNREISKAINAPDVKERFTAQTFDPTPGSPGDFLKLLESEDKRWRDVQSQVKVRLD
jgi:tripartite-type tricarboxylate transporter receptor subunit TctC